MNKQEELWAGEFGDEYESRNWPDEEGLKRRRAWLSALWDGGPGGTGLKLQNLDSVLEIGAGSGFNLSILGALSLWRLGVKLELVGTGVNAASMRRMKEAAELVGGPVPEGMVVRARNLSIFPDNSFDMVMTCGLLIHIHPEDLETVYSEIWRVAKKIVLVAEYFSPEPREVTYRGQEGVLWTRDFGGEMLRVVPEGRGDFSDRFVGNRIIRYGCERKSMGGYDDLGWWILRKAR